MMSRDRHHGYVVEVLLEPVPEMISSYTLAKQAEQGRLVRLLTGMTIGRCDGSTIPSQAKARSLCRGCANGRGRQFGW